MPYIITLQDAPTELPERARTDAESRFRRTLERALGGPDAVADTYRAWQQAEEASEMEMRPEDIALAKKWITAAMRARNEGFRDLGECEAYFEVRLER
ncbi:hypothetical protein [Kerstersia gyiorum]|jgi:hypothetical protein|uniref:Uncharacterized protein n=1 Tax=Kerstersia gyiorum TaxID=206506 RepID=A0A171KTV1_9BURK|nr:hypothetical protein [Kerstersia gyiorum]AZV93609.1 hypothetical protein CBF45_07650 [Bordetella sp. J329]MCO7640803.1 hypothetical protein [Pseudomonas sp. S 311-6]KAB0543324.1 hypothetical protein F7P85_09175 [Kerstersia gyiorum]KKO72318.1 hypothetical protein AAV32_04220 [Kerstersia gyiorum]MCH4271162.1 hypothetical protein [Kerstersia gyiorum]